MNSVFWAHLWPLINILGLSFFTSLAVTGFMVTAGLGDEANERSNHKGVTPSAGGLGLIAGFGVAVLALALFHSHLLVIFPAYFPQVLTLIFATACLGVSDDVLNLSAQLKFLIMAVLSILAVWLIGAPKALPLYSELFALPPTIGFLGASLWVFVLMNAVNFMDGSNGIVSSMMSVACLALGIIALSQEAYAATFLCGVLFAGLIGFMPYNSRNKAKIFMGDVGSLVCGFIFAIASLILVQVPQGAGLLYLGPLLILPILADVFMTLMSRARRKQRLLDAHKDHLYQNLIAQGLSHISVAWIYGVAVLLYANISILALKRGLISSPTFLLANIVTLAALYVMVFRRLKNIKRD